MKASTRFHLTAISIISLVIVLVYEIAGPAEKPAQPVANSSARGVRVVKATWGRNCNSYIDQAIADRQNAPIPLDENGKPVALAPITRVVDDNVHNALAKQCDGQLHCDFRADNETMGLDPLESCVKSLELIYRCSSLDRLRMVEVGQGEIVKLDCAAPEAAPADAAAKP